MTRRVLKFEIIPTVTEVETGDKPEWLSVGWQGEKLVAWCVAETGHGTLTRLAAVLTGNDAPDSGTFVGTAMHPTLMDGAPLVVHVWARGVFD